MIIITALMTFYVQSSIQLEEQQEQLSNNEYVIDSLIQVSDSLTLQVDTLLRQ